MLYLDTENKKPIQLYINCTGGDVRGLSPAHASHGMQQHYIRYEVSQLSAGFARIDAEYLHDADHASGTQMLAFCRTY